MLRLPAKSPIKRGAVLAGLAVPILGMSWASAQYFGRGLAFAAIDTNGRAQEHCFADTLEKARSCVLDKCRAAGAGAGCQVTAACNRAEWSGMVSIRFRPASFTMTMCGVPSRVSLIVRLKDLCRTYRSRGLESCTLDVVWTPAGVAEATNLVWTTRTLGRSGGPAR